MFKNTEGSRQALMFHFALLLSLVSAITSLALVGLEAYVRWNINQDFSFLSGNTLSIFIAATFALILGLAYIYRTK